jgi:hypothetical protein
VTEPTAEDYLRIPKIATANLELVKSDSFICPDDIIPSLIIFDKPQQCLTLLMHLKKFSELLVSWGQGTKAIQISKIISRAYSLFELI